MDRTLVMILSIIALSTLVSAFGVSNFYYGSNPLRMNPGETREITFLLQNMVGDQDFDARAEIIEGREIARISDNGKYEVLLGMKDVPVKVTVSIPEKDKAGKKYEIKLGVTATPRAALGMVSLSQGTGAVVPVEVMSVEGDFFGGYKKMIIILTILAVVIALVIVYIVRRKSLKRGGFYDY